MPNWVENTLKITGNEKELKKFSKKLKPKRFMHSFIPLPKELKNTESPPKKKNLNLILKYKTDNWYDWQRKNWGTKWDFEVEEIGECENERIYSFESAWSPPIEGITTISKKFPKLTFWLSYEESGMGFKGMARIQDGTIDDKCFNY